MYVGDVTFTFRVVKGDMITLAVLHNFRDFVLTGQVPPNLPVKNRKSGGIFASGERTGITPPLRYVGVRLAGQRRLH